MPVMHYVVTLFGTNSCDGLSINAYTFETAPTESLIILISEQSAYQHNLFLWPAPDCPVQTSTPSFNLRCYSPNREIPVPPFTSFAAAHVLFREHKIRADRVVIMENNRRLVFPRTSGQLQCHVQLEPTLFNVPAGGSERVLVMDIFGIVRRDLVLEYADRCSTLVIYDFSFDVERIKRLEPVHNKRYSRISAAETLDVDYVVICVADKQSGGIYVRGLMPRLGYADVDVPLAVLPYLKSISEFGPDCAYLEPSVSMFEIAWTAKKKKCRLIKTYMEASHPSNSSSSRNRNSRGNVVLIAEATTIQAAQI